MVFVAFRFWNTKGGDSYSGGMLHGYIERNKVFYLFVLYSE